MTKSKVNKKKKELISTPQTKQEKEHNNHEAFFSHDKNSEAKKNGIWGNFLESSYGDDFKNSINNFVNLTNNSIYGMMHTSNDFVKHSQNMLSKVSSAMSDVIEQNMEQSSDFLKCQTATDMIELQQKLFERNFSNIIDISCDMSHCYNSMSNKCYENLSSYTEKSAKCFVKSA